MHPPLFATKSRVQDLRKAHPRAESRCVLRARGACAKRARSRREGGVCRGSPWGCWGAFSGLPGGGSPHTHAGARKRYYYYFLYNGVPWSVSLPVSRSVSLAVSLPCPKDLYTKAFRCVVGCVVGCVATRVAVCAVGGGCAGARVAVSRQPWRSAGAGGAGALGWP